MLGPEASGMALLLDITCSLFTVLSVKFLNQGRFSRDPLAVPPTKENQVGLEYLNNIVKWLIKWRDNVNIDNRYKLTKDTFNALIHTCEGLQLVSNYLLDVKSFKYVLLDKFTTDRLENRFGQYRQISGGSYNITVQEILQSEKRLKVVNMIRLMKSQNEFVDFKNNFSFSEQSIVEIADEEAEIFFNHAEKVEVPPEVYCALMYMSGYVAKKAIEQISCDDCIDKLIIDKDLSSEFELDTEYIQNLDRGGLKYPSEFSISFGISVFQIFDTITSPTFITNFLKSG